MSCQRTGAPSRSSAGPARVAAPSRAGPARALVEPSWAGRGVEQSRPPGLFQPRPTPESLAGTVQAQARRLAGDRGSVPLRCPERSSPALEQPGLGGGCSAPAGRRTLPGFDSTNVVLKSNGYPEISEANYKACIRYGTSERFGFHVSGDPRDRAGPELARQFDDLYATQGEPALQALPREPKTALGSWLGGQPQKVGASWGAEVEPVAFQLLLEAGARAKGGRPGGPLGRCGAGPREPAAELADLSRWAQHLASWAEQLASTSRGLRGPPPGLAARPAEGCFAGSAGYPARSPNGPGGCEGCFLAAQLADVEDEEDALGLRRGITWPSKNRGSVEAAAWSPRVGQQEEGMAAPGHADEGHEDDNEQEEDGFTGGSGTMGHHLRVVLEARAQDLGCVFVVRRINTLTLSSPEILSLHFSTFGPVIEVLVPHSKVKPRFSRRSTTDHLRVRPGSIGFVVMSDARSVEAVLQVGKEQFVAGKRIIVERFKLADAKPQQRRGGSSPLASTAACDPSQSSSERAVLLGGAGA